MGEAITELLQSWNFSPELIVFIISMLPILELRGGLIVAAVLGVPWHIAFPICVVGNMLPIPFVLLFIRKIFNWLERFGWCAKLIRKFEDRVLKKGEGIKKSWLIGLYLFVAIPLPGTGGWTGSLIATLFNMPKLKSFFTIVLGNATACRITTLMTTGVLSVIG